MQVRDLGNTVRDSFVQGVEDGNDETRADHGAYALLPPHINQPTASTAKATQMQSAVVEGLRCAHGLPLILFPDDDPHLRIPYLLQS